MARLRSKRSLRNHQPFSGEGVSLYAGIGSVVYRQLRLLRGGWLIGTGGVFSIGGTNVTKTARIGSVSSPATEITSDELPASYASQTVTFDVRHWNDNVENENADSGTANALLDGSRDLVSKILGTAKILEQEQRAGGVVRLRFTYNASPHGTQPALFRATRTAGPTSPADATTGFISGNRIYQIDTPALSDSSAYTYTISAEDTGATVTTDLLTGIIVNADATGPTAPISGTAEAW